MSRPYFATQARVVNAGSALERGQSLADMMRKAEYQQQDRALADEMRSRMPELYGGAMAGDQASLAELARYSPETAMGISQFTQKKRIQDRAADLNDRKFGFTQEQAGIQNQLAQDRLDFNRNQADRDYNLRQQRLGLQMQQANRQQAMHDLQMQEMQDAINSEAYQRDKQIMVDTYRNLLNAPAEQRPEIYEATKSRLVANGLKVPEEFNRPYDDSILDTMRGTLEAVIQQEQIVANKANFSNEMKLRKEYMAQAKPFITQRDAYSKLVSSMPDVENATPADDIALIFNYMKVLDPSSVVREGEFATAQNAGGVSTRIRNLFNSVKKGTRLSPQQRQDIINLAGRTFKASEQQHEQLRGQYSVISDNAGLNRQNVLPDLQRVVSYAEKEIEQRQQEQEQYNQKVQQFQSILQGDQSISDLETLYNGIAD